MKSRDKAFDSKYDVYAEHPRFGRPPRYTGLNPDPYDLAVNLHPNATNIHEIQKRVVKVLGKRLPYLKALEAITPQQVSRIAGTAIPAVPDRQNSPTVPVTHYFDVERVCRGCKRPFIFFAREQQHWFEELGLRLEVDCVRCVDCRRKERGLARKRADYEQLIGLPVRNWRDSQRLCECALDLVEAGVFHRRVLEKVRRELRLASASQQDSPEYRALLSRLSAAKSRK